MEELQGKQTGDLQAEYDSNVVQLHGYNRDSEQMIEV